MPKILFNLPSQFAGRPSGVARVAFELLARLIGRGNFEYALRSPWKRDQLPESLRAKALDVIVVERPSVLVLDVVRQALTFPAYCRRQGIDLVVNLDPFGSPTGGRARLMVVHDLYFRTISKQIGWRASFTNDWIFRLMLRGNSEVVTVSDATRSDLAQWYPQTKERATTIYSASSIEPVEGSGSPQVAGRYVLAVGNATNNKNFEMLASAMARIHDDFPDSTLVHVGADPN
jgi:glycosyltransferase involved in cell wall biosynthesis